MYGAGGQKRVPDDFVRDFVVAMPVVAEQTAIATFLDHETAKIDALVEEQKRLIELLKEKRQAVISHAVTKGLNPNAPMKDSGVEWLGEVPAHWQLVVLKRLGSIRYGIVLQYALLSSYLKCFQIDLLKLRAAQPHLNAEELGACFVVVPPRADQADVIRFLAGQLSRIDALIAEADLGVAILQERRTALISAAVTGKIDVQAGAQRHG